MDKEAQIKIIEETQSAAEQMRLDDIEENPELAEQFFECSCCGKTMQLAGSIQYGNYRLCNECVVIAETGLALGKIKNIDELIKAMEDKRLEEQCRFLKQQEQQENN